MWLCDPQEHVAMGGPSSCQHMKTPGRSRAAFSYWNDEGNGGNCASVSRSGSHVGGCLPSNMASISGLVPHNKFIALVCSRPTPPLPLRVNAKIAKSEIQMISKQKLTTYHQNWLFIKWSVQSPFLLKRKLAETTMTPRFLIKCESSPSNCTE